MRTASRAKSKDRRSCSMSDNVIELERPQRQFHVRVFYEHLAGEQIVSPEKSAITFVHHYEVDGVHIWPDYAVFRWAPFGELRLVRPSGDDYPLSTMVKKYVAWLDTLTLDDVLEESDFPEVC